MGENFSPKTRELLVEAGFDPRIVGFVALGCAVDLAAAKRADSGALVEKLGLGSPEIERHIRIAVARAWSGELRKFFAEHGVPAEKRPTNAECVAALAKIIGE